MLSDENYKATKQQFEAYYEKNMLPTLLQIEKKRKKILSIFYSLLLCLIIWVIFAIKQLMEHSGKYLSEYGMISCVIVFITCWPMLNYYRKSKESVLPLLAKFWGNFVYSYQNDFSEKIVRQSMIIKSYDMFKTDDSFEGKYKNVPINIIEYELYKRKYIRYNETTKSFYAKTNHGIIFIAQMNKKFQGNTIVVKDKGFFNKFSRYENLQKVGLESPEFEKKFEVYSDNQIEARYLLTTVMMEYMLKLKALYPHIEFSFFNNQVFINIETPKNMFECSHFFRSIINKKKIYQNFEELYLLFSIVECLHLNQKRLL